MYLQPWNACKLFDHGMPRIDQLIKKIIYPTGRIIIG